jgi:hypothetical protein
LFVIPVKEASDRSAASTRSYSSISLESFMSRKILATAVALAMLAVSAPAEAQLTCNFAGAAGANCSLGAHNLTATVERTGKITISGGSTDITPTAAHYEASETTLGTLVTGPTFTVKSNATYNVTLDPTTWTAPYAKAIGDVALRVANVGACPAGDAGYTALTAGSTSLVTAASPTASAAQDLCIKVKWLWTTDVPGPYTLPLVFKITAP